jgi:predicted metal-dependent hydrolase
VIHDVILAAAWHGVVVDIARDRDPAGRPRNARPRDAAGRPLPRGAEGFERVPEDLVLTADESITEAQRLLDADLPFPAHDVLEAAWKSAPAGERELWRGLAQLAVGLTHAQRGNARGAAALLDRAAHRIGTWAAPAPAGLDIAGLQEQAHALARQIEQEGLAALSEADLRPRLRGKGA